MMKMKVTSDTVAVRSLASSLDDRVVVVVLVVVDGETVV